LWAVAALISEWTVDNLKNNAVSVTLGADSVQFIKQPDGSYTAPAGVGMILTKPGGYQLQQLRGNTFNFDPSSLKINSIVDPYGKNMTFNYSSGRLSTVVDGWGGAARTLTFNYNTATPPQLTSVSDGAASDKTARNVTYNYATTYNPQGDLVSVVDPEGKTWAYVYDANHNITQTLDPTSPTPRIITQNIYDANFKVYQQYCQGDSVHQVWNLYTTPRVEVQKDPVGGRTIYYYDEKARLVGVKDPNGNKTTMVYDGQNHIIQQTTPLNETTSYLYDGFQNLLQVTDPLLNTANYYYDPANQYDLLTKEDFLGNKTTFTYSFHQPLTITYPNVNNDITKPAVVTMVYNADGTLKSQQDPDLRVTSFQYDSRGGINRKTYFNNDFETYTYNTLGDLINHVDGNTTSTDFTYNHRRQPWTTTIHAAGGDVTADVVTTRIYDNCGNLWTVTDPNLNTTTQTYSATRKPVLTSFPPARLTTIPTVTTGTPTIQKLYDYRDWLKTVTDPLLHNFNYIYDGGGRLYQTSDQLSHTTTLGYDNDGHKTSVTSPLVAATQTTQFGYNPRGDQTTMTDAANSVVNYTYDNNGQPLTTKNRDGNTFTSTYYNDGRPWTFRTPKLNTTTYTYFPSGLLNSLAKPSAKQSSYTYDNRGRLWTLTDLVGSSTYGYDADNNLLTHSENSKSITRVYDKLNRTTSYTDENGNIIGYVYDANGNLTQLSYPGNNIVKYKYDANNRLYQVTDWNNAVTTFTRDLAGRVLTTTRPNQTVRSVTYDNVGGTLQIEELSPTGYPISLFMLNYDEAGRATNEVIAPLPIAYTESARLSTFDVDNRIATFNGQTVAHDVDGNMTSGPLNSSTPVTHVYDARNRLTSVAASGSAPALIYGYDSEGNRTSVIQAGQTAVYVVSPVTGQVLMRIKSGVTTYYIYGEGLLYQVDSSGNTATYHYDSRGSTVAITDGSGNVTDRAEYSPYGATILRSGTTDTPFLYNGRYGVVTDANGLLFMRARYYNPYLCRFINADPSGFAGGLNFYAYANGNPISMTDPTGLYAGVDDLAFTAGGAVLGAVGQGVADLVSWNWTGWSGIGRAAAAGAAGGEATLYGTPIVGAAVFAATKDTLDQSAEMATTGNSFSFTQLGVQTGVGTLTSYGAEFIPLPAIQGLNAGQGSFDAVTAQMLTKLDNGTIQILSWNTGGQMFVSQTYGDIPDTLVGGVTDGMQYNLFGNSGGAASSLFTSPGQSLSTGETSVDWLGNPVSSSSTGKPH
jgi:RHS repeat-associated protein